MNETNIHPKVSIILLNYNSKIFLNDCLEAIKENTSYTNYEVIMVDNNSTDDSVTFVRTNYPWVFIIETGENRGFSAGNNVGIQRTDGEYVFLLNTDTIVQPKWLSRVVETAKSDPKIGVVGALPVHMDLYNFYRRPPNFNRLEEVSEVAGAAMLVKRELILNIGPLDEYSFLYWEDTEFCWRSILSGYKVVYDYDAVVYHHLAGTSGINPRWIYEKKKNELYTYIKLLEAKHAIYFSSISVLKGVGLTLLHPKYSKYIISSFVDTIMARHHIIQKRREFKKLKLITDKKLLKLIKTTKKLRKRDEKYWRKEMSDKTGDA
jgi:hypothetical protein